MYTRKVWVAVLNIASLVSLVLLKLVTIVFTGILLSEFVFTSSISYSEIDEDCMTSVLTTLYLLGDLFLSLVVLGLNFLYLPIDSEHD